MVIIVNYALLYNEKFVKRVELLLFFLTTIKQKHVLTKMGVGIRHWRNDLQYQLNDIFNMHWSRYI